MSPQAYHNLKSFAKAGPRPYNRPAFNPRNMDFSKAKELMRLQQEIAKIQKELSNTHVEAEADGLVVTIDCQLKAVSAKVEKPELLKDQAKLEAAIVTAANKGLKKAQEIAGAKMQGVAKQMGIDLPDQLPGMA